MEPLLAAIEAAAPVAALKRSFIVYPLVNALHIVAIGTVVTTAVLMDLRVLGRFAAIDAAAFLSGLRPVSLGAFAIAILSGAALFSVRATEYAENPAFLWKLGFLVAAGLNLVIFLRHARKSGAAGFDRGAKAMALLSMGLWIAAVVAGRMIGFL